MLGGVAGCIGESGEPQQVTIEVSNTTDTQRRLHLQILPAAVDSGRSENTLFQRWLTLDAQGTDGNTRVLENVFKATKAHLQVGNQIGVIGEYTFIPDCSMEERFEEEIRINLTSLHTVAFDQNSCYESKGT